MTTRRAILLCENPRSAHWRLEPPLSGRFVLLGWRHSREDEIEGGVPDDVASLLARSLTRVALVTFPSGGSEPVAFTSEDHVRTLRPTRWRDRLRVIVSYSPLAFGGRLHFRFLLVSSRRPDVVKTLFDGVSWSMQAQAIFLSAPDAPAPTIDWRTFMSLQRRAIDRDALVSLGLAAIMIPGVDGDVAGLMATTDEFERQVLSAIEHQAARCGADWRVLLEDAFADELVEREQ